MKLTTLGLIYFLAHAVLILIGVVLCVAGGPLWTAIGTGLIATGVAGGVIYVYVSSTDNLRDRLESLRDAGLTKVFQNRAAQIRKEYDMRLSAVSRNLDILGFGLSDFKRDYLDKLGAMASSATVRILLIEPHTSNAVQRDVEENQSQGVISAEVEEFLRQYKNRYGSGAGFNQGSLKVKVYRAIPTVNVFRIDDDLFWGPYLSGRASGNSLTLLVKAGSDTFAQLQQHFNDIWERHSSEPAWDTL